MPVSAGRARTARRAVARQQAGTLRVVGQEGRCANDFGRATVMLSCAVGSPGVAEHHIGTAPGARLPRFPVVRRRGDVDGQQGAAQPRLPLGGLGQRFPPSIRGRAVCCVAARHPVMTRPRRLGLPSAFWHLYSIDGTRPPRIAAAWATDLGIADSASASPLRALARAGVAHSHPWVRGPARDARHTLWHHQKPLQGSHV